MMRSTEQDYAEWSYQQGQNQDEEQAYLESAGAGAQAELENEAEEEMITKYLTQEQIDKGYSVEELPDKRYRLFLNGRQITPIFGSFRPEVHIQSFITDGEM